MKFIAGNASNTVRVAHFRLANDNWDDWFKFETTFRVSYVDLAGNTTVIGSVKIGELGMPHGRRPAVPGVFEQLGETFFSLGQDVSYYERLNDLGASVREAFLRALNDIAFNPDLFQRFAKEEVARISLMRSVPSTVVTQQFNRIAHGGASLTAFSFSYLLPTPGNSYGETVSLDFDVEPQSYPPTNIHALIGRNGVGKTRMLSLMTQAVLEPSEGNYGSFQNKSVVGVGPAKLTQLPESNNLFSCLVSVTFSAFDSFEPPPRAKHKEQDFPYAYVGLKRPANAGQYAGKPKSPEMLAKEFVESLEICLKGARKERWLQAIAALDSDPVFQAIDVGKLASEESSDCKALFSKLSSGHKIVLLTITKLVEYVQEKTLVLLDEPEAHLHPPLLSAFVRALSDLLINRNGVAFIATHSPVVLQEVPSSCVWKLQRIGKVVSVSRPELETFGENVGLLTREVFGLEITQSGFHKLLLEHVGKGLEYEEVLNSFGRRLGGEGRAIVRALIHSRNSRQSE